MEKERVKSSTEDECKAHTLNIEPSATLEKARIEPLKQKLRGLWRKQNAKAIQAYNHFVKARGIFSDELKNF
jgi:post-segregation antitoxin (ccd killing protein)